MPASQPKSFFPLPEAPRMPRRRPNALAKVVSTLGILGVLVVISFGVALWRFDLNTYKPKIEAAISAATGRSFAIHGQLSVVSWFTPTVSAGDVVLGNLPGAAQPDMLKIPRVEADLGFRALLAGRIDIARLVFIGPDLRLGTAPDGTPNWRFTPTHRPAPTAGGGPARQPLIVRTLHVKDGRVVWQDRRTGAATAINIRRLSATEGDDATIRWGADLQLATGSIEIAGRTGSLVRLLEPDATTPWSVYLRATLPGAQFTLAGALREPWRPAGYDLTLDGTLDDLAALGDLAKLIGRPLPPLPPLHRMAVTLRLTDAGGAPALVAGSLSVGPSDLGALVAGLRMDSGEISASAAGQPARFTLRGSLNATPLTASGTFGTLADLGGGASLPVDAALALGDSRVEVKGRLGDPATGAGADLLLSGRIRDLTAFTPLAHDALPPLQDFSGTAHLLAAPGGWRHGIRLPEFALQLPQGDLGGVLDLVLPATPGARPNLTLRLRGDRLDLDALNRQIGDYRQFLPLPDGPPSAALPFARTIRPLIPDSRFDLAAFSLADVRLTLDYGELDLLGLPFKDLSATVALKDGKLLADPVHAQLAGGPADLRASLDSTAATVPVSLRMHAPGLSVRPLLRSLGAVQDITGTLTIDADLTAAGRSLHAWAASASGYLAADIVDGTIDNAVLVPPFAGVLRVAHLSPDLLFAPGQSRLRCFALRLDSTAGAGRLATLLLDADRALVQADGTLRFSDEAMDLRLRPTLRIGGPGLVVPLLLRGSFRSPVLTLDQAAVTGDVATALADAAAGRALPNHLTTGRTVTPSDDQCTAALAVVRGTAGGSVPGAPPTPVRRPPPRAPRR
jgi:uncharacterized protein involved in outer membrane biogenesis